MSTPPLLKPAAGQPHGHSVPAMVSGVDITENDLQDTQLLIIVHIMLSDMWSLVTSESGLSLVFQGDFIPWHSIYLWLPFNTRSLSRLPPRDASQTMSKQTFLGSTRLLLRWSHQLTGGMTTTRCSNHVHLSPPGNDHISHHGNMDGKVKIIDSTVLLVPWRVC